MSDQREMTRAELDDLKGKADRAARMPQVRDRLTRLEKAADVAASIASRMEERLSGYLSPDTTTEVLADREQDVPRRVTAPVADEIEGVCVILETLISRVDRLFDRLEA